MMPKVRVLRVNRDKRECGCTIGDHSHNYYELVYYLNAEGRFFLESGEHRIKTGRFSVIRPNVVHREYHEKDGIVFFCVFESDMTLEGGIFDDDGDGTVRRLCEYVAEEFFSPRRYSNELLELMFTELILRILRWEGSRTGGRRDISYAAELIGRGFREDLDMRALAAEIGYGYDYFHHLFRRKYGLSPKQYQKKCRIDCARKLLLSGDYTCTEVAYLSGFYDSAQFAAVFKREVGMTPTEFARAGD